MPRERTRRNHGAMPEDLDARLRRLRSSDDAGALLDLGCALADAGRHEDAEWCFRRATRVAEQLPAFESAPVARRRADGAAATGDLALDQLADPTAAAVVACRQWCSTLDPELEDALRAGADHLPAARADLGDLLRSTGRIAEARWVLERGAKLGEAVCWLPLGNLYVDDLDDVEAAEEAYRAGIAAGDTYCHHNLGVLLADRGDVEGAVEHFRQGAAAGDALAAEALRDLGEG
jgi:tetratricopeptide (TPR) repeat protein